MKIRFLALLRDTAIIMGLTFLGGFILGVVFALAKVDSERMVWAMAASNMIWGTAGFFIAAMLTRQNRWAHLWQVSLAVWVLSLMNVLIMGATLAQWVGGLVFILLMMGIGGGIASLIVSEGKTESSPSSPEANDEETRNEAFPAPEEIAPGAWFYERGGRYDGPVRAGKIVEIFREQMITPSTLVWKEGMASWTPLRDVPELWRAVSEAPAQQKALQDVPEKPEEDEREFFHISAGRLLGMSVATLGIYQAYWMYRNWLWLREKEGLKIMPFWRAVFGVFFIYPLFDAIRRRAAARIPGFQGFAAGLSAMGWIIVTIIANGLSQAEKTELGFLGIFCGTVLGCLFLFPARKVIDALNRDKAGKQRPYHGWTTAQYIWLMVGGLLWLLVLVGAFVPTPLEA